jgi:hypothetical protein
LSNAQYASYNAHQKNFDEEVVDKKDNIVLSAMSDPKIKQELELP